MNGHKYKKKMMADGAFQIVQERENNGKRVVSEAHQGYVAWLSDGNTPLVIPYTAPPATPVITLEDAKSAKMAEITDESARRCADLTVFRVAGFPEKFTEDVRTSMLGRFAELTYAKTDKQLKNEEAVEMDYLLSVFNAVKGIQAKEFTLKSQVIIAETVPAVNAVVWADDTDFSGTESA